MHIYSHTRAHILSYPITVCQILNVMVGISSVLPRHFLGKGLQLLIVFVWMCVYAHRAFTERQAALGVGVMWETQRKTRSKKGERGSRDGGNEEIQTDTETESKNLKNKCKSQKSRQEGERQRSWYSVKVGESVFGSIKDQVSQWDNITWECV